MEFKKLTDEMMAAARDYVPLMEKVAFLRACATEGFDRMELRLTDDTVLRSSRKTESARAAI